MKNDFYNQTSALKLLLHLTNLSKAKEAGTCEEHDQTGVGLRLNDCTSHKRVSVFPCVLPARVRARSRRSTHRDAWLTPILRREEGLSMRLR